MTTALATTKKFTKVIVGLLRLFVGATFVISGLSKSIDVWGFTFKIEQYLSFWGIEISRPLVTLGAATLSYVEFLLGVFVLLGCYRRVSVWLSSALMLFMTVFSAYAVTVNPVADCGCFGELMQVPNVVTLLKNLALCVALAYLILNNRKVKGFYNTYLNWVVGLFSMLYVLVVGSIGISVQPMVDFRDFKVGTHLFDDSVDNVSVIYEKNGETRQFTSDNLPDSTWTFVEVVNHDDSRLSLSLFSGYEEGDELTDSVAELTDSLIIVSIPEIEKTPKSAIAKIQRLKEVCDSLKWNFVAISGSGFETIADWRRLSLCKYDILTGDDTTLKAMVRGDVGVVCVKDKTIRWKYTLESLAGEEADVAYFGPVEGPLFAVLSLGYLFAMLILKIVDFAGRRLKPVFFRRRRQSSADEVIAETASDDVAKLSADDETEDKNTSN